MEWRFWAYRTAIAYFIIAAVFFVGFLFLQPSTFGFEYGSWYWNAFRSLGVFFYPLIFSFIPALILLVVGSPKNVHAPDVGQTGKRRFSVSSRWVAIVSGVLIVAPLLFVEGLCVINGFPNGCSMGIILFAPLYLVTVPVFIISIVFMVIRKSRG